MNNSEKEQLIIDYIYGELKGQKLNEFERELAANPALREEVMSLGGLREQLSAVKDEEMDEPVMILSERKKSFMWKHWMSVAATLLFFLTFSYLTGFQVQNINGSMVLSFGAPVIIDDKEMPAQNLLEKMIEAKFDALQDVVDQKIIGMQSGLDSEIESLKVAQESLISEAVKEIGKKNEKYVAGFVAQLSEGQRDFIENMFTAQIEQQDVYMQKVVNDFAAYMEEQRQEDLEYISGYITAVKDDSEQANLITRDLIASIYTQVNNSYVNED